MFSMSIDTIFFLQNDLEEFFSMVNFTNPGVLGDATYFRRYYEVSIEVNTNQDILQKYELVYWEENIRVH